MLVWAELRRSGPKGSVITAAKAPAASVFKLVTTAALFEAGRVRPQDRVCISGGSKSIERRHLDVPRGPRACGPFLLALGYSRNAVYAQLATQRLARQELIDTPSGSASIPGSVRLAGADGPTQRPLQRPRVRAHRRGLRRQHAVPLGGAYLASIIAQGGLSRPFHLARRSQNKEPSHDTRVLSATTARRITHMMEVTVHSGTSHSAFTDEAGRSLLPGIRVAGKTGTLRPDSSGETTSWFIGFAPSRKPEIVVSVMLENGAMWRQRAAEVARDLLRAYFHHKGAPNVGDPLAPLAG